MGTAKAEPGSLTARMDPPPAPVLRELLAPAGTFRRLVGEAAMLYAGGLRRLFLLTGAVLGVAVRGARLMRRVPEIARLEVLELFYAFARVGHDGGGRLRHEPRPASAGTWVPRRRVL